LGSVLPARSSFERETRPLNFVGTARLMPWRASAAFFMSERVSNAHQKAPAIPEMAKAASKAVKRDAPNPLIAAYPPTNRTTLKRQKSHTQRARSRPPKMFAP
jgi:hypothetical protein